MPQPARNTERKKATGSYPLAPLRAKELLKATRNTIARADAAIERTRKILQQTEEIFQHNRARRERADEQKTRHALTGTSW